eukprot:Nitzschia sp. Nitz4//scaffold9_size221794//178359//180046//NITZ4_001374-RA/size221794-snap-gene-0.191-mRNA-1//-1//CDS//3329561085//3287//frame0
MTCSELSESPSPDDFEIDIPDDSDESSVLRALERLQLDHVNHIVAKDLSELDSNEREKILYDLHGVYDDDATHQPSADETQARLRELRQALAECRDKRHAYDMAVASDADYVHREDFLLNFLRVHDWDIHKTARRILLHFDTKLELFGPQLLCKDITQDDMSRGGVDVLYSGWLQDLPLRDTAGRMVSIAVSHANLNAPEVSLNDKKQRLYYGAMDKLQDKESQIKGSVGIAWIEHRTSYNRWESWELSKFTNVLPMKIAAFHFCIVGDKASSFQKSIASLLCFGLTGLLRVRTKVHFGTPQQLKETLQSFGIPASFLPVDNSGQVLKDYSTLKLTGQRKEERIRGQRGSSHAFGGASTTNNTQRREVDGEALVVSRCNPADPSLLAMDGDLDEDQSTANSIHGGVRIPVPGNNDVLLGRGRLTREHLGNIRFRLLIEGRQTKYDVAPRTDKVLMAAELVDLVHSQKGRFLKVDGSMWIEVDDAVARKKVANCFRTFRHRRRKDMPSI